MTVNGPVAVNDRDRDPMTRRPVTYLFRAAATAVAGTCGPCA
jgi:hypothetical protein